MLKNIPIDQLSSWKALQAHFNDMKNVHMKDMFAQDLERFNKFSIKEDKFLFDYSKNRINSSTIDHLLEFAKEADLADGITKMFSGERINATENRSVLHTALRNFSDKEVMVDGKNVMPLVSEELRKVERFSQEVISGKFKGFTGKKIEKVINIGIGGSDLGPAMVVEALKPYRVGPEVSFVSNVDGAHLSDVLMSSSPETTLFVIVSKTFTTQETMTNARSARAWILDHLGSEKAISNHFVAVSTNSEEVENFGISLENQFLFWDWVGGRYSVWSSVGLSIALSVGYGNFEAFLKGAHKADLHFSSKDFSDNIPVMMALLGIWYNNFFECDTAAVLPYNQLLSRFPAYLQQADMESNGKSINRKGKAVQYQTGPVIWGEPGTNGQHAFYQLIHQGTKLIPCDFIGFIETNYPTGDHHDKLFSNFLAQTRALMEGRTEAQVREEMGSDDLLSSDVIPFKCFEGNKPTNSIVISKLNPENLGLLMAFYEHKIFVQGYLWDIFSFDQWGVELGKKLAVEVLSDINQNQVSSSYDSSTSGLLRMYIESNM